MKQLFFIAILSLMQYGIVAQTVLGNYEVVMTLLRTGETELFRTSLSNGNTVNLTRSPKSEDRYPAVSADGKKILFTSNRWDNDTAYNLFVMNADGTNTRQISFEKNEVVYYPGWSADGKKILYNLGKSSSVIMMNADGSAKQTFSDMRDAYLSPDAKQIVFTRQCGVGFCLFVMDIKNNATYQLTQKPNPFGAVGPVFSADGKQIAFVDCPDPGKEVLEIYTCAADGSNIKQLTQLGKISTSPCWSPDGKWISFRVTNDAFWRNDTTRAAAYKEKAADKRPVWIIRSDGTNAVLLEPLRYQCGIDGSRAVWIIRK